LNPRGRIGLKAHTGDALTELEFSLSLYLRSQPFRCYSSSSSWSSSRLGVSGNKKAARLGQLEMDTILWTEGQNLSPQGTPPGPARGDISIMLIIMEIQREPFIAKGRTIGIISVLNPCFLKSLYGEGPSESISKTPKNDPALFVQVIQIAEITLDW
jgi:hypothetical protein